MDQGGGTISRRSNPCSTLSYSPFYSYFRSHLPGSLRISQVENRLHPAVCSWLCHSGWHGGLLGSSLMTPSSLSSSPLSSLPFSLLPLISWVLPLILFLFSLLSWSYFQERTWCWTFTFQHEVRATPHATFLEAIFILNLVSLGFMGPQ